jgi:hypothetical protein
MYRKMSGLEGIGLVGLRGKRTVNLIIPCSLLQGSLIYPLSEQERVNEGEYQRLNQF